MSGKAFSMERFSKYLIDTINVPQSKAKMYVNLIRRFQNHVGKPHVDIKQWDIVNYLSFLKKQELLKDRSIYLHLVAIKKFYNYLWSMGDILKIPSEGVKIKYRKKKYPSKTNKRNQDSGIYH